MLYYGLEPDDKKLAKIHSDYASGKLLSGELKQILVEKMSAFLETHHKNREKSKKVVAGFVD